LFGSIPISREDYDDESVSIAKQALQWRGHTRPRRKKAIKKHTEQKMRTASFEYIGKTWRRQRELEQVVSVAYVTL